MKNTHSSANTLLSILIFFVTPCTHTAQITDALFFGNRNNPGVQTDNIQLVETGEHAPCCSQGACLGRLTEACCGPRKSAERQFSIFSAFVWGGTIITYAANSRAYTACRSNNPEAPCTDIQPPMPLVAGFFGIACISLLVALTMRVTRTMEPCFSNTNTDE